MKRKLFICLVCLFLGGCSQEKTLEDQQFDLYDEIKEKLMTQDVFEKTGEFHIALVYNQLESGYRYDIIIDQPKIEMYHILAMSYAQEAKDNMCPNIGIFDDENYNLKANYIDKASGFYKGIQLSGIVVHKQSVKVYISYYTDSQKTKKVEKYVEVFEDETR